MSKKGFAKIGAIIVLVLIGGVLLFTSKGINREEVDKPFGGGGGLFGKCEGKGITKLNLFPLDPKDIELIIPMGRVQDSHVTP